MINTLLVILEIQWRAERGYHLTFFGLFFSTKEDMFEYVRHPDYGETEDRPGLCAGISYEREGEDGH